MKARAKERMPLTSKDIVMRYFSCIDGKDVDGALELFDNDAVVHEPFSNVGEGLKGKAAIHPFLKVAMMANSNLKRSIEIQKPLDNDRITALVTFEKGDRMKGRFTFEFSSGDDQLGEKKIKSLHIKF